METGARAHGIHTHHGACLSSCLATAVGGRWSEPLPGSYLGICTDWVCHVMSPSLGFLISEMGVTSVPGS